MQLLLIMLPCQKDEDPKESFQILTVHGNWTHFMYVIKCKNKI